MKAVQFFAWFQSRTGRGEVQGPPSLLVSLPNVIPRPRVVSMARHSEEDFRYTRKLITESPHLPPTDPRLREQGIETSPLIDTTSANRMRQIFSCEAI
ncbi:MAG: hypothetical protein CL912_34170 [Deltaproteobacteria bacterium]|nr:hypothetical protein [Deltaproteobacteria bacterium]